jgi:hypothetical protein
MTSTIFVNFVKTYQQTQFRNVLCNIACPPYLCQDEVFAVLGRCAAEVDSWLPTFCDSLSFSLRDLSSLVPKRLQTNYRPTLFNISQDRRPPAHISRKPEISSCKFIKSTSIIILIFKHSCFRFLAQVSAIMFLDVYRTVCKLWRIVLS